MIMEYNVQIRLIIENSESGKEVHLLYKQQKISFIPQIGSTLSTGKVECKVTDITHVLDTDWNMIICRPETSVEDLTAYSSQAEEEGWTISKIGETDDVNF